MRSELNIPQILQKISLNNVHDRHEAGLIKISLPVPPQFPDNLALTGPDGTVSSIYQKKIGNWIGAGASDPRRLLLIADAANKAPQTLGLAIQKDNDPVAGESLLPDASMELFETCPDPAFAWERHMAVFSWQGKKIGLVMGLNTRGKTHWWEACRLTVLDEQPACREIEIGGAIPLEIYDTRDISNAVGYENPYLHKHNWLNGHIYARLHANGVCEIYAHHINSKFFDDGLDLEDAVPVIGFKVFDGEADLAELTGPWTGDRTEIQLGQARLDLTDARHMVSQDSPGSFAPVGDFYVWQPYEGFELFGGAAPRVILDDEFIFRAKDKIIPRGMARTVRFSISLSDRSPRIAHYLAPAWWYGLCEEFLPDALLPVSNDYDALIESARKYIREYTVQGNFEDGSVPRNLGKSGPAGRYEPGWEGEMPGGQFLAAWRSGCGEDYDLALRSAYVFTDVHVDHAMKTVRMHGYPPEGISIPMNRVHGPVLAYLETGDPYLLRTAQAVIDTAYAVHKNSWPRLCVGRDACFIRGAVLLYRYFNSKHYQAIAQDSIKDVIASQKEDGSFGDQGGGTGVHQWAAYIVKPWMGLMALGGVVDYLELHPDEPAMLAAVKRFGDWLLKERFMHNLKSGGQAMGWNYQHYFKDDVLFMNSAKGEWFNLKDPDSYLWHVEYLARFLGFCSFAFADPAYLAAWAESYEGAYAGGVDVKGDHAAVQIFQYIPWLQARLWNARLTRAGVAVDPYDFGPLTKRRATVLGPDGKLEVGF